MSVEKSKLNWIKNSCIIGAACVSMNVFAGEATIWSDSAGDVVKDGAGDCLHTIWWKKGGGCGNTHKHGTKEHTHDGGSSAHDHNTHEHGMKEHTHDGGSLAHEHKAAPAPKPVVKAAPVLMPFSLSSAAAFKTSGSALSGAGKTEVSSFANKLKGRDVKKIRVDGYTDSRGTASSNQALSEKRAQAVKAELIANGVDANLIEVAGHGESNPIASNDTSAGRAQNRRVNVTVDIMQ